MPIVGSVSLSLAFGFSILTLIVIALYLRTNDTRLMETGRRMSLIVSGLSLVATFVLLFELVTSNFDIDYVAHYTSFETPLLYKLSALWAGQAGSLLFWLAILSFYTIIVVLRYRFQHHSLMPWVIIILTTIQVFFLLLTVFVANPFGPTKADFVVQNGMGLNPLLQNLTMAIHPPTLYLGYVGFAIPFAFALASLITRDVNPMWIRSIRKWTLITWGWLTIGIILGGWWAYQELGWGGYWAWDPVENASFMPWLTGTALLHSIIIQEKKNMLRVWNMTLVIITFTLSIFGTFLTRSGVMSSVHSFAQSAIGPLFLYFIALILIVSFGLLFSRLSILKSEKRIESFTSRESGFLFNNVIFIVMCFTVFWGTIFPVLSEAVRGTKITVGAPFFNQVNIPIGLVLLFLTGVGPLLAWRKTSKTGFIRNFSLPLVAMVLALIVFMVIGYRGYTIVSFSLAAFVLSAITVEFVRGISVRIRKQKENVFQALMAMVARNKGRYGGYVVHLGIVFMFIGFTGHAFDQEKEFGIKVGESEHIAGYDFELMSVQEEERPNHYAWIADIRVTDIEGEFVTRLVPEKRIYFYRDPNPNRRQPHSELSVYETVMKDIYSIFNGIESENQTAYFKIMVNPLVWWVWFGGYLMVFGTIIALWPNRKKVA